MTNETATYKSVQISIVLTMILLKLKRERILKYHKHKQILGKMDRRLGLLDPNGYDFKHYQ